MASAGWATVKLIKSNGRELEVRNVGNVIYRLEARTVPIKFNGAAILTDDEARDLIRQLAEAQKDEAMWTAR